MKNLYEVALKKNEVAIFFRGKGEYFDLDREFGVHNKAFTVSHIFAYRLEKNEEVLFKQLGKDLVCFINLDDFYKDSKSFEVANP